MGEWDVCFGLPCHTLLQPVAGNRPKEKRNRKGGSRWCEDIAKTGIGKSPSGGASPHHPPTPRTPPETWGSPPPRPPGRIGGNAGDMLSNMGDTCLTTRERPAWQRRRGLLGNTGETCLATPEGPRDQGQGTRGQGPGTRNQGPGARARNQGSRARDQGTRAQGLGPRGQDDKGLQSIGAASR